MPKLCFPCSPNSTTSHFDEKQDSVLVGRAPHVEANSAQVGDKLEKPTGAEYTSEAAKEFLRILETVAQEIPIPGVGAAVKIATNLIQACEDSHATLEKAEELKMRIRTLVTIVVNELKAKKSDEVREKLREDIDALQRELKYIEKKLDEIASQHALLLVIFKSINEDKVQNCMSRVDGLIERFTITRQIDHAILLDRLEKEIVSFYNAQKQTLDHIQDVVEDIHVTMNDVKILMKNNSSTGSSSPIGARAAVPANKSLFYGRDTLVSRLAAHLASGQKQRHTCILGPGGIGKTSTALAVMAQADVKRRYTDEHRVWVPCVKAASIATFLDTLASSLGITQMTGNISDTILSTLKTASPLILLLDNFETPWNIDGGRSETERILRDIHQIPHITLFITMRSSAPPCPELSWHSADLKAVDAEAARQIYTQIFPESNVDSRVPELLELIGHMPLAITLMATSASLSGLPAKALIDQYKRTGPTMLSQGSDTEHSLDICISLSVDSGPMKRSPEAQWLLFALAMLPVGTTYDMLTAWWARNLSNITGALQVLRETSLIERQGSTFSVLPVIQSYILHPSRIDHGVRASMIESACDFLERHRSSPGDASYLEHAASLAAEGDNLEAVLLQAKTPSTKILNALLVLTRYQASARPRTSLVSHALALAQEMENINLHASVLSCYGSICNSLNRYEESRKHHTNARELFLSVSDMRKAADCLLACVFTYQADGAASLEICNSLAIQAESEFASVDDEHGLAKCWLIRGTTIRQFRDYDSALSLLRRAKDKFTELRDPFKSAKCSDSIAWCYYWKENFEEAKTWSESAVQGFDGVGPSDGHLDALLLLGFLYNVLGLHAAALQRMLQCLEQSKVSGGPLHVGLALEQMGIAWMQLGKKIDAKGAFQEALEVYPPLPSRHDHGRCRYWRKKADNSNAVPTSIDWMALREYYPSKALFRFGVQRPR